MKRGVDGYSFQPERSVERGTLVVSVSNLSFKTYDRVLFEKLNFAVRAGEVVAVTGESGSE